MKLYHGSNCRIIEVDLRFSKSNKDFVQDSTLRRIFKELSLWLTVVPCLIIQAVLK